jgi:hypothetical protein
LSAARWVFLYQSSNAIIVRRNHPFPTFSAEREASKGIRVLQIFAFREKSKVARVCMTLLTIVQFIPSSSFWFVCHVLRGGEQFDVLHNIDTRTIYIPRAASSEFPRWQHQY